MAEQREASRASAAGRLHVRRILSGCGSGRKHRQGLLLLLVLLVRSALALCLRLCLQLSLRLCV
jgi:hypothetical protein